MIFRDRQEAGRSLAELVLREKLDNPVIYALPRGGVVVGHEVAKKLKAPLELIIARKIGHPYNPEYAIAAVTEKGPVVANDVEVSQIKPDRFQEMVKEQRLESARRRQAYLGDRRPISPKDRIAVVVDDGIATGLTMMAAVRELKNLTAKSVVVAVPVMPVNTYQELCQLADQVIALEIPQFFAGAIGAYYQDFDQISDEEVIRLLDNGLKNTS